jgi:N-acyl homoserine lactone hydrolase
MPGVNVGKPIDFVDTCYVIGHGHDWMVRDTGLRGRNRLDTIG